MDGQAYRRGTLQAGFQWGQAGYCPPGCPQPSLPWPLGPVLCFCVIPPRPCCGVEGLTCVSGRGCGSGYSFVHPLFQGKGACGSPCPLCLSPGGWARRGRRDTEYLTPPPALLPQPSILSLPCSLENAKTHDVNKSTVAELCPGLIAWGGGAPLSWARQLAGSCPSQHLVLPRPPAAALPLLASQNS